MSPRHERWVLKGFRSDRIVQRITELMSRGSPDRVATFNTFQHPNKILQSKATLKEASPASVDSDVRRMRSRNRVGWALLAACGAALLGIWFYFREGRLAPPITVPQVAIEAHEPTLGGISS